MKFRNMLAAAALAALYLGGIPPALAGNTTLFSSTSGDVVLPISPPTNAGATPGRLDNTDIGDTTPAAGHFTNITGSTTGPVAATTLSASGAVTGAGFTALLASPPAIGGTAPAAGTFTTDSAAGFYGTGAAPVPTGTGTPTIAAGSTNFSGEVTAGASATSVIITFAGAPLATQPFCVVRSQSQITSFAYTLSASAITITQTATSANLIDYICGSH